MLYQTEQDSIVAVFLLHGPGPVLEMSALTFTLIEVPALAFNVTSVTILKQVTFIYWLLSFNSRKRIIIVCTVFLISQWLYTGCKIQKNMHSLEYSMKGFRNTTIRYILLKAKLRLKAVKLLPQITWLMWLSDHPLGYYTTLVILAWSKGQATILPLRSPFPLC